MRRDQGRTRGVTESRERGHRGLSAVALGSGENRVELGLHGSCVDGAGSPFVAAVATVSLGSSVRSLSSGLRTSGAASSAITGIASIRTSTSALGPDPNLEAQLLAARRTPAELAALVDRVEENVRANIRSLREALADQVDLREVFHTLFPSSLAFEAARTPDGGRQIWKISGDADFGKLLGSKRSDRGFECVATPTRNDANETGRAHASGFSGAVLTAAR
jgi:hypothetical protein